MGDPKRPKKHYRTPSHPWQKTRIEEEQGLVREYGFVNKKEIWRVETRLLGFKARAKSLVSSASGEIGLKKRQVLIDKLNRMGIMQQEEAAMEDVLSLTFQHFADRRLQSLLYRKGLARTIKQARQFIVHGHVTVGDKKITAPSYLVLKEEEEQISFVESSSFSDENHPERTIVKKEAAQAEDKEKGADKGATGEDARKDAAGEEAGKETSKDVAAGQTGTQSAGEEKKQAKPEADARAAGKNDEPAGPKVADADAGANPANSEGDKR